jgi:glycosyltransferase involved in cell wall biosynthesis
MKSIYFFCDQITQTYGVDRTVIEIAGRAAKEYQVEIFTTKKKKVLSTSSDSLKINVLNENVSKSFFDRDSYFSELAVEAIVARQNKSQIYIVVCGWPFLGLPNLLSEYNLNVEKTIFIDFGLVPASISDFTQISLRKLRMNHLTKFSQVIAISEFIMRSNSLLDVSEVNCQAIPLSGDISGGQESAFSSPSVPQILLLGRPEFNYKNAQIFPELIDELRKQGHPVIGKFLGTADHPLSKKPNLYSVGHPSDEELVRIMSETTCSVSLSEWEGFNLPLAEAQWLSPTFCFSVGAHSEVVIHQNQICQNISEMIFKIGTYLDSGILPYVTQDEIKRTWQDVANDYIESILNDLTEPVKSSSEVVLIYQCTNAYYDTANSGVVNTTRSILAEIAGIPNITLLPMIDLGGEFVVAPGTGNLFAYTRLKDLHSIPFALWNSLAGVSIKSLLHDQIISAKFQFLDTEVIVNRDLRSNWEELGALGGRRISYIQDLIPLHYPEIVAREVAEGFEKYLAWVKNSDFFLTSSQATMEAFVHYLAEFNLNTKVFKVGLGVTPNAYKVIASKSQYALMVSTIEPRKNHKRIIEAFIKLNLKAQKGCEIELFLVGNSYPDSQYLIDFINDAIEKYKWIHYLGAISELELDELYRSAFFTVYGSTIEGYGLPIIESLNYGKPCLVHNRGVMIEHAAIGGCINVDMDNEQDILDGLVRIANPEFNATLKSEIKSNLIQSWEDVTRRILKLLDYLPERSLVQKDFRTENLTFRHKRNDTVMAFIFLLFKLAPMKIVQIPFAKKLAKKLPPMFRSKLIEIFLSN